MLMSTAVCGPSAVYYQNACVYYRMLESESRNAIGILILSLEKRKNHRPARPDNEDRGDKRPDGPPPGFACVHNRIIKTADIAPKKYAWDVDFVSGCSASC